jgi:cytochrome c oxidase cbb3-type subunit 3
MSDFFSEGWSIYIAVATVASLIGCLALLVIASRSKQAGGDGTSGHVWDVDLRELNNPMPRWWMILFVITVIFGFAYLALYPGLGSVRGAFGWSSAQAWQQEQSEANTALATVYAKYAGMPFDQLARDRGALAIGERLFVNNCAACHGSDARGAKGFPNLADDDWLHGGSPEKIVETITGGRQGMMPPMAAAVGGPGEVSDVAEYVLSLSGSAHDDAAARRGGTKFVVCAGCHGIDGKGNPAVGAPNLADRTWLHGYGKEAILAMVNGGKTNVMPAQEHRLTSEQIHVVGAWVWSLSHPAGVATAAAR